MTWTVWRGANSGESRNRGTTSCSEADNNWYNLSNIATQNSIDATAECDKDCHTHWLRAYNFGHSADISAGDLLVSIELRFRFYVTTYNEQVQVDWLSLGDAVGLTPNYINQSDGFQLPNTYTTRVYGGSWESWGYSALTAELVADTDWSIYVSFATTASNLRDVHVDSVETRIEYWSAASLHLQKPATIGLSSVNNTISRVGHQNPATIDLFGKRVGTDIIEIISPANVDLSSVATHGVRGGNLKSGGIEVNGNFADVFPTGVLIPPADIQVGGQQAQQRLLLTTKSGEVSVGGSKAALNNWVKTAGIGIVGPVVYDSFAPDGSATISDLELIYSGGATVTNQHDSLGGVISSAIGKEVYTKYQHFTLTSYSAWAATTAAYGNPVGIYGELWFLKSPDRLEWTPDGYTYGDTAAVNFTGAGDYVLGDDTHGYLEVTCDGTIPASQDGLNVFIADPRHRMFDPVNPYEAYHGKTDYRCFYVKNTASNRAYGVTLWIEQQPPLGTSYELGIGTAPIGDGVTTGVEQTIATEYDAPVGVNFSSAPINSPILLGTISMGESRALWVKRTVLPEITELVFFNPIKIGIAGFI